MVDTIGTKESAMNVCAEPGCRRKAFSFGRCFKHMLETAYAMADLHCEEHEKFTPNNVPIELEDDWRAPVIKSSRLPTGIRINPEGSASLRYMRDGRSGKLPVAGYEGPQLSEPTEGDYYGMTLDEIAIKLDVDRETVSRIIRKALRKLRHTSRSRYLGE